MAANGILNFRGANKTTFVGTSSNIVLDNVISSLGIGVDVNGPTSNLHVVGNAYVSTDVTIAGNIDFQTITQNGAPFSGGGGNAPSPWVTSGNDISYSTGNVAVDTNTLFVDSVNNRVGIGTLTPATALDVSGDMTIAGNIDFQTITQNGAPFSGGGGNAPSPWVTSGNDISYSTGNVAVDTNTLFVDSVNNRVGIATATPGYTLDVTGDVNFTGNFTQGGNPFRGGAFLTDGTKAYYTNGPVGISNVEALTTQTLQVGANVAVNDTASDKLTVTGNAYVSRSLHAVDLVQTYQVNCNALFIKDVRVTNREPHDGNDAGYTPNVL